MNNGEITVKVNSYGAGRPLGLVYFDPITGKKKAKSAGTSDWREAERLAGELERELRSGRYAPPSRITWEDFRSRFRREHLAGKAPGSRTSYEAALNHVERRMNPDRLAKLTTACMSEFQARLRSGDPAKEIEPMKETTIATTLRHVKAALNWSVSMGLLVKKPEIKMPRRSKGQSLMKGRPITEEEFERMLAAAAKIRKHDASAWQRYLTGLWLSGLRLEESLALSWDVDAPFSVDLSGRRPAFRIMAEAQKARRDEMLPMTPDLAEWLMKTPESERSGRVFSLPVTNREVGRVITRIGRKAGVVVNKTEKKTATAHDLRRAFGTRWAKRVMPAVLQKLMRHAAIQTTMSYYVGLTADAVADELWAKHPGNTGQNGNTFGNNDPQEARQASTAEAT